MLSVTSIQCRDSASAAWFLIRTPCMTLKARSNERSLHLGSGLHDSATLRIHLRTSCSIQIVDLWPSSWRSRTWMAHTTARHSRWIVSQFWSAVLIVRDQIQRLLCSVWRILHLHATNSFIALVSVECPGVPTARQWLHRCSYKALLLCHKNVCFLVERGSNCLGTTSLAKRWGGQWCIQNWGWSVAISCIRAKLILNSL